MKIIERTLLLVPLGLIDLIVAQTNQRNNFSRVAN